MTENCISRMIHSFLVHHLQYSMKHLKPLNIRQGLAIDKNTSGLINIEIYMNIDRDIDMGTPI